MGLVEALTAARAAYELASVAIDARDDAKIKEAMHELREKLWDTSNTAFSQLQALHSLELETQKLRMQLAEAEREKVQLHTQIKERAMHPLAQVRPGIWAHIRAEDSEKAVEDRPHFCAACYSNGKVVPLRYFKAHGELSESWNCPHEGGHRLTYRPQEPGSKTLGHDGRHWMG